MSEHALEPREARQLARRLLEEGNIIYGGHAKSEMAKDQLSEKDIERALRGICDPAEWENEQWRYRFHSYDVWAVATFEEDTLVIIITAWRKER